MAIRIREVDGVTVAICAARSVEKPGDVYLDDGVHQALSAKFHADLLSATDWPEHAIMEREESDNANRVDWDATFGVGVVHEEAVSAISSIVNRAASVT